MARRGFKGTLVCVAALAAAVLPAAAQARVVEPVWVNKKVGVASGQTKTVTLKCPAHAVALNGAAPNAASSIPNPDARRWTFRFLKSGSATLRCVRLRLPHSVRNVNLEVGTIFEPVFEIPPNFTQTIFARCHSGESPTGWGLERRTDTNGLSIAAATPTRRGWLFKVKNFGPVGAAGSLAIRCLDKKARTAHGERHVFGLRVASFNERIEGGGTTSRNCRGNEYSVSTGVSLPDSELRLTGTTLFGPRAGEWSFSNTRGSTPVTTSLICLARNTGFRG
jgi:hypothetical protein